MATKKLTKEELKSPDFFISHGHQFAELVMKYQAALMVIGAIVIAGSLGWLGMNYWHNHVEAVASADLYPTEKKIQTEMEKTKTVSDASLADYEKAFTQNASSRAALVSLMTLTQDMIKAGKAQTAAKWYSSLTYRPATNDVQFGLMKMAQGMLALENHQPDQALGFYQDILNQEGQKSLQPDAMLKIGVAYQMKNDTAKAREMFEKVHREHPTSQAGELAFQYLLYLDQKTGA